MLVDPKEYVFLREFQKNIDLIIKEYSSYIKSLDWTFEQGRYIDGHADWWVKDNGFHHENIGFDVADSGYSVITLFKKGFPVNRIEDGCFFPQTRKMISMVPNPFFACIAIMQPGSVLKEHTHTRSHLIYHLLLNDLVGRGYELNYNGELIRLKNKGDEVVFDYSKPHGVINDSANVRVGFALDFLPN